MKKIILLLSFLSISTLSAQNWVEDFDEAKKIAKAEKKPLVMVFQGSDWCPPCKRLNKNVLKTNAFKTYANDSLVLVTADFLRRSPITKSQVDRNQKLATKYNPSGRLPRIVVFDSNTNQKTTLKYRNENADEFLAKLKLSL